MRPTRPPPPASPPPAAQPSAAKAPNLADRTYEHLRELILSREIPGGAEIPEGRLAERLQLSRTPVREALVRLVGERLLERTGDRAYRVRIVTAREFFDCMQMRELLECHAIEAAVPRIADAQLAELREGLRALDDGAGDELQHWQYDNRFHSAFARAAGNEALEETVTRMRVVARLFRISGRHHRKQEVDGEHLAILDAAERRDPAAARAAMLAHLRALQDDVRRAIVADANPAGYFL
ncbi:GntR family transcriptional regulator [Azospirillum picis]|uniref:DNA-binding GntR family transcriptional regulator n=1 Tax=Azospirillum picis TaxID=488438 RepID=A0ABU0MDH1_9PROT|nr:GntR family transcriptional regulator [Azospirillum picis]MBP2297503.1 DNA-binding GntR family transcriptional regulator [Azospirillum picis]MDQ0531474.1 DNA-binding GntR family transcriptional regulator [Azospirillum picis]